MTVSRVRVVADTSGKDAAICGTYKLLYPIPDALKNAIEALLRPSTCEGGQVDCTTVVTTDHQPKQDPVAKAMSDAAKPPATHPKDYSVGDAIGRAARRNPRDPVISW